ncbi:MAG: hypothetical protein U9N14_05970 [Pseudomonadota bacterium]|nr:hypothetical protein [Pseudomonadota bacterium]
MESALQTAIAHLDQAVARLENAVGGQEERLLSDQAELARALEQARDRFDGANQIREQIGNRLEEVIDRLEGLLKGA